MSDSEFPAALFAFMMILYGFILLFALASWVASALALFDCARRAFPDPDSRALWCLALMLTHIFGAAVYYFVIYRAGNPPYQPRPWAIPPPPPKET